MFGKFFCEYKNRWKINNIKRERKLTQRFPSKLFQNSSPSAQNVVPFGVTRFGELSPIGRLFTLGSFLKIIQVCSQNIGATFFQW
jgi:hypothetical protein